MIEFLESLGWFQGIDTVLDVASVFILAIITVVIYGYHEIKKKDQYWHLSVAFGLLSASFVFKIIAQTFIYSPTLGTLHLTDQSVFFMGTLLYRSLTLLGLYLIYSVYLKKQPKVITLLIIYLIFMLSFLGHEEYYVFHITAMIFLSLITLRLKKEYKNKGQRSTLWLTLGFGTFTLSQVVFIFLVIDPIFYIVAEGTQLFGHLILIFVFVSILKHGKKETTY